MAIRIAAQVVARTFLLPVLLLLLLLLLFLPLLGCSEESCCCFQTLPPYIVHVTITRTSAITTTTASSGSSSGSAISMSSCRAHRHHARSGGLQRSRRLASGRGCRAADLERGRPAGVREDLVGRDHGLVAAVGFLVGYATVPGLH